jgi:hypothetical protein
MAVYNKFHENPLNGSGGSDRHRNTHDKANSRIFETLLTSLQYALI